MKRHGFSGQPASHGNSLSHRAMGSAGQSQGGGSRVLPGKKMAGRMGGQQVTVQNVRVLKVDEDNGLVVLNGTLGRSRQRLGADLLQGVLLGPMDALLSCRMRRRKEPCELWPIYLRFKGYCVECALCSIKRWQLV